MSQNRQKNSEMRKSPVSGQKMPAKSSKSKTPKAKASKSKPLSNGSNGVSGEITNGVDAKKMEDQTAKINLLTLQKMDSSVCGILATVPHVVLYEFKKTQNVWERTSSEGTLFVYNRDTLGSTKQGFMILNRLNSDNTQEEICPGMEFRLQPPFILYGKQSGAIFGLCIQDQDNLTRTVQLLNRLSSKATPTFTTGGSLDSTSGSSSSSSPALPTEDRQSSSPTLAGQHTLGANVDVMEMLEVAGRGYLGGQCFSDDTDSHDETQNPSPPKKGGVVGSAGPTVSPSTQNLISNKVYRNHSSPNVAQPFTGHAQPRATSPRAIPRTQQRGVSSSGHSHGQSPQKAPGNHPQQQRHQAKSPSVKHDHAPSTMAAVFDQSPHRGKRGVIQHAASFDQFRTQERFSTPTYHSGNRSNSLFGGSPYMAAAAGRQFHSAYPPSRAHSAATGVPAGDSIVRKLFEHQEPAVASSSVSLSLQTLFSQAATTNAGPPLHLSSSTSALHGMSNHHPSLPLVTALSVDEIEKQLTAETSKSNLAETKDTPSAVSSSNGSQTVLLQPSAFVSSPAVSMTQISVEPPSPLVAGPRVDTHTPQVFPSIPPLMHSAGMTAPPLPLPETTPTTTSQTNPHPTPSESSNQIQGQVHHSPLKGVSHAAKGLVSSSTPEFHTPPPPMPGRSATVPGTLMSPQQFSQVQDEGKMAAVPTKSKGSEVSLTTEQMQEALMYMIQNDHSFIDKLHEAYKMSRAQRLS